MPIVKLTRNHVHYCLWGEETCAEFTAKGLRAPNVNCEGAGDKGNERRRHVKERMQYGDGYRLLNFIWRINRGERSERQRFVDDRDCVKQQTRVSPR